MRLVLLPLKTHPRRPVKNFTRFVEVARTLLKPPKPDLIVLPEAAFTGYLYEPQDLEAFAEPIPGPTTARMAECARAWGVWLGFGLLERTAQGIFNTAVLLDRNGRIVLKHRKIAEQPPFLRSSRVPLAQTEFGRLAFLICGDLFDEEAWQQIPRNTRLVLVPMARSFDEVSPDPERWEREERRAYQEAVARLGVTAALVNALEVETEDPCFGGAMLVSGDGRVLAESPHGTDTPLVENL